MDIQPEDVVRLWRPGSPPSVVVWEITLKCDLGCRHCGSRAGAARSDELSTAEALDVVEQLARLGVEEVILIGGEAYLREDWADIARAVTANGMACSMVTGGRGLDAWRVAEATEAGIKQIGVSIDGIGLTHDKLRGSPGSYEAAIASARRITAAGMALSINSQINRLSAPELPAIADLCVELGAVGWQFQLTVPLGRAADRPDLILQPYELLSLMPLLHWIKNHRLSTVTMFPGNNIGYFGPYEAELRFGGKSGHSWSACAAGRSSLGIEADGKIKGCPSLPTEAYAGGNVREAKIADIWRSRPEIISLGQRTTKDLWGFCATCEFAERCLAGCTWTAHALFGRPGNNPYCHHRALALAKNGQRETVKLIEAAPGRPFDHGRFELCLEPSEEEPLADWFMAAILPRTDNASVWSPDAMTSRLKKRRPPAEPVPTSAQGDVGA